jgi:hypothetical protein
MSSGQRLARSIARVVTATATIGVAGLAALMVVLRQPTFTELPFRGASRCDAGRLKDHVAFLTRDITPRSASHPENLDRAASYIFERFSAAGGRTYTQSFVARGGTYRNVIAEFGPASTNAPVLVVGAHYDSFGETGALPGADDNASGTAGVLELARLLGSHRLQTPVLLVAYTTEEPPFFGSEEMGSAVHAASLAAASRMVSGMICLEMIGYFSDQQAWPNWLFEAIYPSKGNFIGVTGGWNDRRLARTVKRAIAGASDLRVVSYSGARVSSDASDHRNYWAHGWRAVMITDTAFLRNPNYHTARDTADTLDYRQMARVVDGVLSAVLHLSSG